MSVNNSVSSMPSFLSFSLSLLLSFFRVKCLYLECTDSGLLMISIVGSTLSKDVEIEAKGVKEEGGGGKMFMRLRRPSQSKTRDRAGLFKCSKTRIPCQWQRRSGTDIPRSWGWHLKRENRFHGDRDTRDAL